MTGDHALGPELGYKPVTYTCRCGFRDTDYNNVGRHIAEENARLHEPRHLSTIAAVWGGDLEVASTPYGDEEDAVEVRMILRDPREIGHYRRHVLLVHRSSLDFLIDQLEAHRLDKNLDPCEACAAQAFAARITAAGRRVEHSCNPPDTKVP